MPVDISFPVSSPIVPVVNLDIEAATFDDTTITSNTNPNDGVLVNANANGTTNRAAHEIPSTYLSAWNCTSLPHLLDTLQDLLLFNDRSHPNLRVLDGLQLTYPGHEKDHREASDAYQNYTLFNRLLLKMEEKQRVHTGDRSHPRLMALDDVIWTYPGWRADFADAEEAHFDFDDVLFFEKRRKMEKRQEIHHQDKSRLTARPAPAPPTPQPKKSKGFWGRLRGRKNNHDNNVPVVPVVPDISVLPKPTPENLGSCIVCGLEDKSHLFIPCGHLCVCGQCADETLMRSECCPMCRTRVTQSMKVFVP